MAKKKTIDELANEILRDFDAGDTPAARASAALQQARDAGDGGLRQDHIQQAQRHIAAIDPARNHKTVQKLQAEVLALQGRGGDRHIAHVTPGEMVIPRSLLTPELMGMLAAVARQHGVDPREFFVGSGRNAVNPHTGQMEFDDGEGPEQIEGITVTATAPPELQRTDRFFDQFYKPLSGLAQRMNVPENLIISHALAEGGYDVNRNNFFGFSDSETPRTYSTPEASIPSFENGRWGKILPGAQNADDYLSRLRNAVPPYNTVRGQGYYDDFQNVYRGLPGRLDAWKARRGIE